MKTTENIRILQLIQNPDLLDNSDLRLLSGQIVKYPYVQTFRALHTKGIAQMNPEDFDSDIEILSIYSTDREHMRRVLYQPEKYKQNQKIQKKSFPEIKEQHTETTQKEPLQEKVESKKKENISERKNKIKIADGQLLEDFEKQREQFKTEKTITVDFTEHTEVKISFPEEQKLLTHQQKKATEQINTVQDKNQTSEKFENISKLGLNYLFNPTEQENKTIKNKEEIQTSTEVDALESFEDLEKEAEKLKKVSDEIEIVLNNSQETIKENSEEIEPETKTQIDLSNMKEKYSFEQWLSLSEKKNKEQQASNKENQEKIIEKFIDKNPKITPPKKEERKNQSIDNKRDEVKNIENLMTVTLAQLYIEQGKYDTAIKAFKILSLKYPEKSSYFASEIRKIKNLK